jgi:hypothetical protein
MNVGSKAGQHSRTLYRSIILPSSQTFLPVLRISFKGKNRETFSKGVKTRNNGNHEMKKDENKHGHC